ncbi:MAG TPA: CoA-transferase [Burkholderiales bacterium]|nr:CoA-transferase [Burkholderiales bacterium]
MTLTSLEALCGQIPNGAVLAIPKTSAGVAMSATRELIRRGLHGLHLIGVPTSGLQADVLIGAGCVDIIQTSAVTLGEFGTGPRFAAAVKEGSVKLLDATCPAIYAGLQAGLKGIPFMPLRGLIGSDVLQHRSDWKVIDNPFANDDPIVLLPSIRPDFALFQARKADRAGNVYIGRERELMIMAQAARQTLVTVEEVVEHDLMADEATASGTIAAIYITAIAVASPGAWPLGLLDRYGADTSVLSDYAKRARTTDGFKGFLDDWLSGKLVTTAKESPAGVAA